MATSHSSSSSQSLFSSIVTLYLLILLYFPHVSFQIIFSPVLISTLILLLTLLRLGASQQLEQQQPPNVNPAHGADAPQGGNLLSLKHVLELESESESKPKPKLYRVETDPSQGDVPKPQCNMDEAHSLLEPGPIPEPEMCDPGQLLEIEPFANHDQKKENEPFECINWAELEPGSSQKIFLEWDVGAPLEVIYEASEEEEEGKEAQNEACWKTGIIERYPSLSRYYPESDSDSYSDSSSSSSSISLGEEQDERDGLIEIALDKYEYNNVDKRLVNMQMKPKVADHYFDEEDNLIEIDISHTKIMLIK